MSNIDVLATLAQEQQRQQAAAQYAEDDAQRASASAELLRGGATEQTHQLASRAERIEDDLRELAYEAREVLDAAKNSRITKAQAVQRLRKARKSYADLAGQERRLEADYAANKAVMDDPAAERDRLLAKYPVVGRP